MKYLLLLVGWMPFWVRAQDKQIVFDDMVEVRALSSFKEIQVEGGIDVYLSPDSKQKVVVSASTEAFRRLIITEVVGNTLHIHPAPQRRYSSINRKMKVYISIPVLEKLTASGASDVFVQGILKAASLVLNMSGASDFAGAVQVDQLLISQSGSSDIKLNGSAKKMQVTVSGASNLKGYDCIVDDLIATASGASTIEITANGELELNASGASDILFKGTGVVKKQVSTGASSIKALRKE